MSPRGAPTRYGRVPLFKIDYLSLLQHKVPINCTEHGMSSKIDKFQVPVHQ